MFKNILISIVIALIFTGCAFQAQELQLHPDTKIATSDIGNYKKIYVKVADDRTTNIIGHRGAVDGQHANITPKNDIVPVIRKEIERGLQNHNFVIAKKSEADNSLTVDIRSLDYDTSVGFWTGGVHLNATLKARAKNSNDTFEKTYRIQDEKRVSFVPTAEVNEKWINDTLASVIYKLLNDKELLHFLAE